MWWYILGGFACGVPILFVIVGLFVSFMPLPTWGQGSEDPEYDGDDDWPNEHFDWRDPDNEPWGNNL